MPKRFNFTGSRVRRGPKISDRRSELIDRSPWFRAVCKALGQGREYLILLNNPDESHSSRTRIDDQLATIAFMQASLANEMTDGKEIGALHDSVGFPPYTWSEVMEYYPGNAISLAGKWEDEGMKTLLPVNIFPDPAEDERRMAVLYGTGDLDELGELENIFVDYFNPALYTKCFGNGENLPGDLGSVTRFFVQWELFVDEAAHALGVTTESPEFIELMEILEKRSSSGPARIQGREKALSG